VILALSGGTGVSKMVDGLAQVHGQDGLSVIVNTGDDGDFYGLRVCPDIDICTYVLAGVVADRGWGYADDTFRCLDGLSTYGEEAWFGLGDRDLATHIFRTVRLAQGARLSEVTAEIGARLGVKAPRILAPKAGQLRKLVVFVPKDHAEAVRAAVFRAGAGRIGAYDECSFQTEGAGTFRAGPGTDPFVGQQGIRHTEAEVRLEVVLPVAQEAAVVAAMVHAHPYEEVAYDLVPLVNAHPGLGAGMWGELDKPLEEKEFLSLLKEGFGLKVVRHTRLLGKPIERIAWCGGSGAFLIGRAKVVGADAYLTSDVKYHEFFDADSKLILADIGHYGSEQFTMNLIQRRLGELFPTFAVRLTEMVTDPIYHF